MTVWPALALMALMLGCGGAPSVGTLENIPPPAAPPPVSYGLPDQSVLKEALQGKALSPGEVADLSDRLLAEGSSTFQSEETMARLDMLLNKSLKTENPQYQAKLMRNLGIIHYHQKKYNLARQELQRSNEINPRDARTHFYLARLFAHQGEIYERQGKKRISKQQFKRATIEMEQARKLEPKNALYRQDIRQIIEQEPAK